MQSMYRERTRSIIDDTLWRVIYHASNIESPTRTGRGESPFHILNKALILQMKSGASYRFIYGMEFGQHGIDMIADNRHQIAGDVREYYDVSALLCWSNYIGKQVSHIDFGWHPRSDSYTMPALYPDYLRLVFDGEQQLVICLPEYTEDDLMFSWEVCDDIMVIFDEIAAYHHLAQFGVE